MFKGLEEILQHIDTIVVLGGVITWVLLRILDRVSKKKKSQGLDNNVAIDAQIYKILWPMLVQYRATRVFILQFHNGENYYTGQSIQRKTMSHEVVVDVAKVTSTRSYFDNVLLSELMRDIIEILTHDNMFGIDDIEKENEKLSSRLFRVLQSQAQVHEYKSVYYYRLVNKKGHTVAILGFHWKHIVPLNEKDKYEIMEKKKGLESVFNKLA